MIATAQAIDWHIGRMRLVLPTAIHVLALGTAIQLALQWTGVWLFVAVVVCSAVGEMRQWLDERQGPRGLRLIPGGIAIGTQAYDARRAWLAPGWTVIWLRNARGRRRLVHVLRSEITETDHAALRRHVKAIEYV